MIRSRERGDDLITRRREVDLITRLIHFLITKRREIDALTHAHHSVGFQRMLMIIEEEGVNFLTKCKGRRQKLLSGFSFI